MDNYATDKTEPIRKWLGARPRWHVPLHADRQFLGQSGRALLRRHHRKANPPWRPSLDEDLETAIRAYLDAVNADPKPFRWTKSADDILAAIKAICLKTLKLRFSSSRNRNKLRITTLDEHGHQIFAITDAIAERVRKIGGLTVRSIGEISRLQRIQDNDEN